MNFRTIGLVAAAAVGVVASAIAEPAYAITLTASGNLNQFTTNVAGATTIDFNSIVFPSASPIDYTSGLAQYTGNGRFVGGSVNAQYAEPPNNEPAYLTLGGSGEPGPVTINFSTALNYFGLYWGSIDAYNSIEFFSGNTLLKKITGADVRNPADGNQALTGARFVDFFADAGESFDSIRLISTSAAFESDNHAYRAVPTPALLPAALGMGVAALRKKRKQQEEDADLTPEPVEA